MINDDTLADLQEAAAASTDDTPDDRPGADEQAEWIEATSHPSYWRNV